MGRDEVRGDRRHLVEPRFAEFPLHVVFLGEAEAAEGLDAGIRRLPGSIRRQELGRLGIDEGPRNRELDAPVPADGPSEDLPLAGLVALLEPDRTWRARIRA